MRSRTIIATPPGATIKEQLDDRGMTQKEFALRMDMSEKHIRACFLIHNHAKSMNYQKENASRMSNIYTRGEANGINDSTV